MTIISVFGSFDRTIPGHLVEKLMSAFERGVSGISLESLEKLCRLLGVSADRILFGVEESSDELKLARKIAALERPKQKQVTKIISALLALASAGEG